MNDTNRAIGRIIRGLRDDAGMCRDDVECISNGRITAAALGSWERGERTLRLPCLIVLCEVYETDARHVINVMARVTKAAA